MSKWTETILPAITRAMGQLHDASLLLLVVCLFPLRLSWPLTTAYALFFSTYCLTWLLRREWRQWKWSRERLPFALMLAFWLLLLLRAPFEASHQRLWHELLKLFAFVGIGVIGLGGRMDRVKNTTLAAAFLLTAAAATVWLLLFEVGLQPLAGPDRLELLALKRKALFGQHMPFNLYLNIALAMGLCLMGNNQPRPHIALTAVLCLVCLCGVLLSEGRMGILTALLIVVLAVVGWLWRRFSWKAGMVALLIGMMAPVAGLRQHERMQTWDGRYDARYQLHLAAVECIGQHPLVGWGLVDGPDTLTRTAIRRCPDIFCSPYWATFEPSVEAIFRGKTTHPHSIYLQTLLYTGLPGLLLLLGIIVTALCAVPRKQRFQFALVLLPVLLQGLTDSWHGGVEPIMFCLVIYLWSGRSEGVRGVEGVEDITFRSGRSEEVEGVEDITSVPSGAL